MKKRLFLFTALALLVALAVFSSFAMVSAQQADVAITSVSPASGVVGTQVTLNGTITTSGGEFTLMFADVQVASGTATGNNVSVSFAVPETGAGNYALILKDVSTGVTAETGFGVNPTGLSAIPYATVLIMLVAVAISFMNMGLNRALITKMIGWHEYRSMQREMSEYNSQRMKAMRANDTKTLEKLKKKESQIQAMQTKMFKPQLVLIPITFIYFIIWPILLGYFPGFVAYVPGFGAQPFYIWYLVCSFFFGTIASRIIGVTPIQ